MELKTKYITLDEFKEYFGIDLQYQLNSDDNESNTALAFLKRVEDRMATYLDSNYYVAIDKMYPEFTDYQKEHYKLALLEQALYIFKNGDISVDSGYDQEEGIKVDKSKLKNLALCSNAEDNLRVCGLLTRKIRGVRNRGVIHGFFWY